jgi:hypothetical protein
MCRQVHRGKGRSGTQRPATPAARPARRWSRGPVRFQGPWSQQCKRRNLRRGPRLSAPVGAGLVDGHPSPRAGRQDPSFSLASHESGPPSPRPARRRFPGGAFEAPRLTAPALHSAWSRPCPPSGWLKIAGQTAWPGTSRGGSHPASGGEPGEDPSELSWLVVEPELVASDAHLRPIERRMRRLVASGVEPAEVAWRFRRSQRSVAQILALGSRTHRGAIPTPKPQVLRPLERRILTWRESGASYAEIGARFRHSPQFVRRVEDLAKAKLARAENEDLRHGESFPSAEPQGLSN